MMKILWGLILDRCCVRSQEDKTINIDNSEQKKEFLIAEYPRYVK